MDNMEEIAALNAEARRRGKSAASQIERNTREAVKRLARVLNCNFQGGGPVPEPEILRRAAAGAAEGGAR